MGLVLQMPYKHCYCPKRAWGGFEGCGENALVTWG